MKPSGYRESHRKNMKVNREYNKRVIDRIYELLADGRDTYRVDLHIHTTYSADGQQTVQQVIEKAKENHFDLISITDHDAVGAYEELDKYICSAHDNMPIIVPGIEFTVSYLPYEGRCHVLKYFFDMENEGFFENLKMNQRAYANRVQKWFQRIHENQCLKELLGQHIDECTTEDYDRFLQNGKNTIPEYATLMEYLYSKLKKCNVDVWTVYTASIRANEHDRCSQRRDKRTQSLLRFRKKYAQQDISHNYRKLRPILAPLGIDDDDYPDFESSGSLSIKEYGQVPIETLVNAGFNVLAHPDEDKLDCVDLLTGILSGLELNAHSDAQLNQAVNKKAREIPLLITKGSDVHTLTDQYYDELGFFTISREDLQNFANCAQNSIENADRY